MPLIRVPRAVQGRRNYIDVMCLLLAYPLPRDVELAGPSIAPILTAGM